MLTHLVGLYSVRFISVGTGYASGDSMKTSSEEHCKEDVQLDNGFVTDTDSTMSTTPEIKYEADSEGPSDSEEDQGSVNFREVVISWMVTDLLYNLCSRNWMTSPHHRCAAVI